MKKQRSIYSLLLAFVFLVSALFSLQPVGKTETTAAYNDRVLYSLSDSPVPIIDEYAASRISSDYCLQQFTNEGLSEILGQVDPFTWLDNSLYTKKIESPGLPDWDDKPLLIVIEIVYDIPDLSIIEAAMTDLKDTYDDAEVVLLASFQPYESTTYTTEFSFTFMEFYPPFSLWVAEDIMYNEGGFRSAAISFDSRLIDPTDDHFYNYYSFQTIYQKSGFLRGLVSQMGSLYYDTAQEIVSAFRVQIYFENHPVDMEISGLSGDLLDEPAYAMGFYPLPNDLYNYWSFVQAEHIAEGGTFPVYLFGLEPIVYDGTGLIIKAQDIFDGWIGNWYDIRDDLVDFLLGF